MRQWRDRYNMAISGTPFRGMNTEGEDVVRLTKEQRLAMVSCVDRDKTMAIFFNEGRKSLPVGLKSILEKPGRLKQIRDNVFQYTRSVPVFWLVNNRANPIPSLTGFLILRYS